MRTFLFAAVALTLVSAFTLYAINYDTRLIEDRVEAKQRQIEKTRRDIAVLKAERAHLSRPEVIAPLARQIGLEPVRDHQIIVSGHGPGAGGGPRQ